MDSLYFDEIHKGGSDTRSLLIKTGVVVLALVLALFLFMLSATQFGYFAFLGAVASIAGAIYFLKYKSKEYEYIFTNGEIDIDIISGQMSRKRFCTIRPENVEFIAKYSSEEYNKHKNNVIKVQDLSSGIREECYIIVVNINHTKMMLVISPSQRLLEAWKPYLKKLDYMTRFNHGEF